jgi:uncharacterized protein DUF6438
MGDSAAVVSLERGPCFGTCPVYAVSVTRTGAVRFVGRRFVRDSGTIVAAIPAARVDTLLALIEAAGFFGFADVYRSGGPGCERYATDLPTVFVEVGSGARHKRVEHDHGCADAPPALAELETRIDSVIGTAKWTGQTP